MLIRIQIGECIVAALAFLVWLSPHEDRQWWIHPLHWLSITSKNHLLRLSGLQCQTAPSRTLAASVMWLTTRLARPIAHCHRGTPCTREILAISVPISLGKNYELVWPPRFLDELDTLWPESAQHSKPNCRSHPNRQPFPGTHALIILSRPFTGSASNYITRERHGKAAPISPWILVICASFIEPHTRRFWRLWHDVCLFHVWILVICASGYVCRFHVWSS
jgi:hypothetical protein